MRLWKGLGLAALTACFNACAKDKPPVVVVRAPTNYYYSMYRMGIIYQPEEPNEYCFFLPEEQEPDFIQQGTYYDFATKTVTYVYGDPTITERESFSESDQPFLTTIAGYGLTLVQKAKETEDWAQRSDAYFKSYVDPVQPAPVNLLDNAPPPPGAGG